MKPHLHSYLDTSAFQICADHRLGVAQLTYGNQHLLVRNANELWDAIMRPEGAFIDKGPQPVAIQLPHPGDPSVTRVIYLQAGSKQPKIAKPKLTLESLFGKPRCM